MIPLSAYGKATPGFRHLVIGRIARDPVPKTERSDHVLILDQVPDATELVGYAGALITHALPREAEQGLPVPTIHGIHTQHLDAGDVVSLDQRGHVRTQFRAMSRHNALFVTDRCNSYCLMCSQPPKDVDERGRLQELLRIVQLVTPETQELGITGGEPTLLKDDFIALVRACKDRLPNTALHVLSNGRLFHYGSFARQLAAVHHPDLMVGIPLYSDLDAKHDHVVQARGAFDETMIGLQNLGRYGVPVEVRVVIHRLTYERLPQLAEFIYRNVTFASHVALMGLEQMGFAVPNLDALWIDPWDYRAELETATLFLAGRGMNVSIYNHQLCTVPQSVWGHCRQSISDWKNEYLPTCDECLVRSECGGFFSSVVQRRHSSYIRPVGPAQPNCTAQVQ